MVFLHRIKLASLASMLCLVVSLAVVPSLYAQSLDDAAKCGADVNFETAAQCKDDAKEADEKAIDKCVADKDSGTAAEKKAACKTETSASGQVNSLLKTVLNLLSAIVGVVAVIMIIVGGLKYVVSSGDSNSASSAKNTILYALVGLVIVAFAQVIVQFILERTT